MPEQRVLIGVNVDVAPREGPDGEAAGVLVIQDKQMPVVQMIDCTKEMCENLGRKFLAAAAGESQNDSKFDVVEGVSESAVNRLRRK